MAEVTDTARVLHSMEHSAMVTCADLLMDYSDRRARCVLRGMRESFHFLYITIKRLLRFLVQNAPIWGQEVLLHAFRSYHRDYIHFAPVYASAYGVPQVKGFPDETLSSVDELQVVLRGVSLRETVMDHIRWFNEYPPLERHHGHPSPIVDLWSQPGVPNPQHCLLHHPHFWSSIHLRSPILPAVDMDLDHHLARYWDIRSRGPPIQLVHGTFPNMERDVRRVYSLSEQIEIALHHAPLIKKSGKLCGA